jgi:DNA-binding MarR family transcriptional regulator
VGTRAGAVAGESAGQHPLRLTYIIGRLDRAVRRELDERLREYGLSVPQFATLSILQRRPGLSNAQLARRALITPQAMSDVTSSLERKGLIRRNADGVRARVLRTELTESGAEVLAACEAEAADMEELLLTGVSRTDRDRFRAVLRDCLRNMSVGI